MICHIFSYLYTTGREEKKKKLALVSIGAFYLPLYNTLITYLVAEDCMFKVSSEGYLSRVTVTQKCLVLRTRVSFGLRFFLCSECVSQMLIRTKVNVCAEEKMKKASSYQFVIAFLYRFHTMKQKK